MRVLVFDTETTGLPSTRIISPDTLNKWPFIVQFSYIIYDTKENEIIDVNDSIIKLPGDVIIPEESINIHKITNEMSREKGTTIEEVFDNFFENLKSIDKIIGHNISFDINIVKVELLRMIYNPHTTTINIKKWKNYLSFIYNFKNIVCTSTDKNAIEFCNFQMVNKSGKPYLKYPKLVELYEKLFKTTPNGLHNSLADIIATLRCYMQLFYNIDLNKTCETFIEIFLQNQM